MSADSIELERRDGIATVWLNRPERRNALTNAMIHAFADATTELAADSSVRVIVVRGRGGSFCSGFDLADIGNEPRSAMQAAALAADAFDRLASLSIPSVSAVEGYATGAGFELMLSTDFTVAADTAKIGEFSIQRAMFGGAGPTYRLPRAIGMRRAKELVLTGTALTAQRAFEWGLINETGSPAEFEPMLDQFVARLADKSPYAMGLTKAALDSSLDADTRTLMRLERVTFDLVMGSDDAAEGVASFLEKRAPTWVGH